MEEDKWNRLDRKTMSIVRTSLSKSIAKETAEANNTKGMMKMLSETYEKPSAMNKVHLIRRLVNRWMAEGTKVTDHVSEFMISAMYNQLSMVSVTLDDEVQALLLLSSLPDSWNIRKVKDLIVGEELRRRESGETSGAALSVGRREKIQLRNAGGLSVSRSSGLRGDQKFFRCFSCGKKGNYMNESLDTSSEDGDENAAVDVIQDALTLCEGSSIGGIRFVSTRFWSDFSSLQ